MSTVQKVTVEARGAYEGLRKLRGKVHLSIDLEELRRDRDFRHFAAEGLKLL
jgi:hypothetical protein